MEIWHKITFGHKDNVDAAIKAMNVKHKMSPLPGDGYLIHIDISESDPLWPQLSALVQQKKALDIFDTVFTPGEILETEWIRLIPSFEQGYPQPEKTWVTNPINYESHCQECGTFRQTASFRLKKEPNLGKKDFMSLYWTYALFCTPRVLSELETHRIRGYEVWNAIIHSTNALSQKVSQLFISTVAKPGLVRVDDLGSKTCPSCNATRHYPHMRGVMYLKRGALTPSVDIMQTYEWFGSGHSAYREILVSNRLARIILDEGWKGIALKVVELI
jgi:hypothetical protein